MGLNAHRTGWSGSLRERSPVFGALPRTAPATRPPPFGGPRAPSPTSARSPGQQWCQRAGRQVLSEVGELRRVSSYPMRPSPRWHRCTPQTRADPAVSLEIWQSQRHAEGPGKRGPTAAGTADDHDAPRDDRLAPPGLDQPHSGSSLRSGGKKGPRRARTETVRPMGTQARLCA